MSVAMVTSYHVVCQYSSGSRLIIVLNELSHVTDVPADVTAEDMQALLQTNIPGMGVISVEHSGDCIGRKWTITWLTVPGEQPLLEVSHLAVSLDTMSYHGVDFQYEL